MGNKNNSVLKEFTKGFVRENPVFVQVLGMCPTLAVTTSVVNGLGMGLATLFVLFFSVFITVLIKRLVPDGVRIAVYTVIIATFVTIADLFMRAYIPPLSKALGPYVPLIVVNCIILGRIEAYATRNRMKASLLDALGMGGGFTMSLLILGGVRELLGSGAILGYPLLGPNFKPLLIMILPSGAFLALGVLMAVFNAVQKHRDVIVVEVK